MSSSVWFRNGFCRLTRLHRILLATFEVILSDIREDNARNNISSICDTANEPEVRDFDPILNLHSLHLIGSSCDTHAVKRNIKLFDTEALKGLKLDSCLYLDTNTQLFPLEVRSEMNLQTFHLRHEVCNNRFINSLRLCLQSFSGLVYLSLFDLKGMESSFHHIYMWKRMDQH